MKKSKKSQNDLKKELRKRSNEIWKKLIPWVSVCYIGMFLILQLTGNSILESGVKTTVYFLLIFIGIIVGHKITLKQRLSLYVPEEKRNLGAINPKNNQRNEK